MTGWMQSSAFPVPSLDAPWAPTPTQAPPPSGTNSNLLLVHEPQNKLCLCVDCSGYLQIGDDSLISTESDTGASDSEGPFGGQTSRQHDSDVNQSRRSGPGIVGPQSPPEPDLPFGFRLTGDVATGDDRADPNTGLPGQQQHGVRPLTTRPTTETTLTRGSDFFQTNPTTSWVLPGGGTSSHAVDLWSGGGWWQSAPRSLSASGGGGGGGGSSTRRPLERLQSTGIEALWAWTPPQLGTRRQPPQSLHSHAISASTNATAGTSGSTTVSTTAGTTALVPLRPDPATFTTTVTATAESSAMTASPAPPADFGALFTNELAPLFHSDFSLGSSFLGSDDPPLQTATHQSLPSLSNLNLFRGAPQISQPNLDISDPARGQSCIPSSPPIATNTMPSTRKRSAAAAGAALANDNSLESPSTKRRKTVHGSRAAPARRPSNGQSELEPEINQDDIVDLVDREEWSEPEEPNKEKWTKLANFQCVICMEFATGLVVTHCGHLFCGDCLDSALKSDAIRNKCPMCRQTVETKKREQYNGRTKGFWPLELKLMMAPRKPKAEPSQP